MTTKSKLKAAAYIRVSTAGQAEEGSSLPEQRDTISARIEAEGWELVEVYADEGVSGKSEDRRELQRLLADLPRLDRVVVTELSRLGRRAAGMLELFDRFESEDVALVSIRQSIDTSSAAGRLLRNVLISVAEFESEQLGERVAAVSRSKVSKGGHHGRTPYGYNKPGGVLVPHPTQSKIVRRIFNEAAAGKTQRMIARDLNADKVKPQRAKLWKQTSIGRILGNPTYQGVVVINGDGFPGSHAPLVTPELWDRVEAIRIKGTRTKEGAGPGRHPAGSQLFTRGLLRCGICGSAMTPRTVNSAKEKREEYRCGGRIEHGVGYCAQTAIKREVVDAAALAYFEDVALDADAMQKEIADVVDDRRGLVADQLRGAVADERQAAERLERVRRDYQDGKLDADDWSEQRAALMSELEGARGALAQAESREAELAAAEDDAANPESEAQRRLESIREAVAGKVAANADDTEALRVALTEMFEAFFIVPADYKDPDAPEPLEGEAAAAAAVRRRLEQREGFNFDADAGGYRIFPMPRPETLEGIGAAFYPLLKRRGLGPLSSDATKEDDGFVT